MNVEELAAECAAAIERWNSGDVSADAPFVILTIKRERAPSGRTIRLGGRVGPTGKVACVHNRKTHYDVVAYFPAVAILRALGITVREERA